jgi:transcriptional regulator with XRE-family HTH domain
MAAGKTQRDAAIELEVTEGTVSRWELDKVVPQHRQLKALAKFYGVTIDHIVIGDSGDSKPQPPPPELAAYLASGDGRVAREHGHEALMLLLARNTTKPLSKRQWKMLAQVLMMEDDE